jgi:hypothetical protein
MLNEKNKAKRSKRKKCRWVDELKGKKCMDALMHEKNVEC